MKVVVDGLHPGHTDIVGKVGVRAQQPTTLAAFGRCIEMCYLPARVYAGIGAPRTDHFDRFVRDLGQGLLEPLLYAAARALALPAVVRGTVVFDADGDAHPRDCRRTR